MYTSTWSITARALERAKSLIGKLASLLAVTVAPQKGHQCQAAGGGPCFVFWGVFLALLDSSSLRSRWVGGHRVLYVVPTAAVHVAWCKILGKL